MTIRLPVRYYRQFVAPDEENREANFEYAFDELPLAPEETALVLVDCWNDHSIDGVVERMGPLIEDTIGPALDAVRDSAITVVHCPSPDVAPTYPEWTRYADGETLGLVECEAESGAEAAIDWPPAAFRDATSDWRAAAGHVDPDNEYAIYAKRPEPRYEMPWDAIHPRLEPEPGDDEFVAATGDQLHRLLAHRGILHLLYVGFHTNICVRGRDYGIEAMDGRGYNPILLRDCTQAIESHDTVEEERHRSIAIREMEKKNCYTATSEDLLAALP